MTYNEIDTENPEACLESLKRLLKDDYPKIDEEQQDFLKEAHVSLSKGNYRDALMNIIGTLPLDIQECFYCFDIPADA